MRKVAFELERGQGRGMVAGATLVPVGACIVRLFTEVIEPYRERNFDRACGSGGMSVDSVRFIPEHKKNSSAELSVLAA